MNHKTCSTLMQGMSLPLPSKVRRLPLTNSFAFLQNSFCLAKLVNASWRMSSSNPLKFSLALILPQPIMVLLMTRTRQRSTRPPRNQFFSVVMHWLGSSSLNSSLVLLKQSVMPDFPSCCSSLAISSLNLTTSSSEMLKQSQTSLFSILSSAQQLLSMAPTMAHGLSSPSTLPHQFLQRYSKLVLLKMEVLHFSQTTFAQSILSSYLTTLNLYLLRKMQGFVRWLSQVSCMPLQTSRGVLMRIGSLVSLMKLCFQLWSLRVRVTLSVRITSVIWKRQTHPSFKCECSPSSPKISKRMQTLHDPELRYLGGYTSCVTSSRTSFSLALTAFSIISQCTLFRAPIITKCQMFSWILARISSMTKVLPFSASGKMLARLRSEQVKARACSISWKTPLQKGRSSWTMWDSSVRPRQTSLSWRKSSCMLVKMKTCSLFFLPDVITLLNATTNFLVQVALETTKRRTMGAKLHFPKGLSSRSKSDLLTLVSIRGKQYSCSVSLPTSISAILPMTAICPWYSLRLSRSQVSRRFSKLLVMRSRVRQWQYCSIMCCLSRCSSRDIRCSLLSPSTIRPRIIIPPNNQSPHIIIRKKSILTLDRPQEEGSPGQ